MSRWWDSRVWPEIGAVADQVAYPHRARPEAAHQDQHTIMVRSLCGTVRLAGRLATGFTNTPGPQAQAA